MQHGLFEERFFIDASIYLTLSAAKIVYRCQLEQTASYWPDSMTEAGGEAEE